MREIQRATGSRSLFVRPVSAKGLDDEPVKKFGLSEVTARRYYRLLKKVGHRLPLKPGVYSTLERIGWERFEAEEELRRSAAVLKLVQDLSRGRSIWSNNETATKADLIWLQTSYGYVGTAVASGDRPENTHKTTFSKSHKFELHVAEGGSVRLGYTGPLFESSTSTDSWYFSVGGSLALKQSPGVETLIQMRLGRIRDIAETHLIREHLQQRLQTQPLPQQVRRFA